MAVGWYGELGSGSHRYCKLCKSPKEDGSVASVLLLTYLQHLRPQLVAVLRAKAVKWVV